MFSSFSRLMAQDVAFGLTLAAISVVLMVVVLWSFGAALGDSPTLLEAMLPRPR